MSTSESSKFRNILDRFDYANSSAYFSKSTHTFNLEDNTRLGTLNSFDDVNWYMMNNLMSLASPPAPTSDIFARRLAAKSVIALECLFISGCLFMAHKAKPTHALDDPMMSYIESRSTARSVHRFEDDDLWNENLSSMVQDDVVPFRIGIIGSGVIGSRILNRFLEAGWPITSIGINCRSALRRNRCQKMGVIVFDSVLQLVKSSNVVILAVGPQHLRSISIKMKNGLHPRLTIISTLAGVGLKKLTQIFPEGTKIIKTSVNTMAFEWTGSSTRNKDGISGNGMRALRERRKKIRTDYEDKIREQINKTTNDNENIKIYKEMKSKEKVYQLRDDDYIFEENNPIHSLLATDYQGFYLAEKIRPTFEDRMIKMNIMDRITKRKWERDELDSDDKLKWLNAYFFPTDQIKRAAIHFVQGFDDMILKEKPQDKIGKLEQWKSKRSLKQLFIEEDEEKKNEDSDNNENKESNNNMRNNFNRKKKDVNENKSGVEIDHDAKQLEREIFQHYLDEPDQPKKAGIILHFLSIIEELLGLNQFTEAQARSLALNIVFGLTKTTSNNHSHDNNDNNNNNNDDDDSTNSDLEGRLLRQPAITNELINGFFRNDELELNHIHLHINHIAKHFHNYVHEYLKVVELPSFLD